MGEVYRARDTRLDRIVAIKVLPTHLADRSELRERFEREAKTIASLNHPHICVLYDIGHQDDIDFLVMEYIEGETLAQRLLKGPLPLEQVLQYAIEISDALDKAHRKGVTHRDLKPGNVMLTKSGTKLLDFGLAKLKQDIAPAEVPLSDLPTVKEPLTAEGTLLGTLQYMAPEQLEGKEVDARTDIFSFGAVVYETATGKRAFEGKTQASLIAKILEIDPPPLSSLQPMTPPAMDRVVKRCLAKDPDGRWQSANDLTNELKWVAEGGSHISLPAAATDVRVRMLRRWAAVAAVACLVVIVGFAVWILKPTPPRLVTRMVINLPPGDQLAALDYPAIAISPDGSQVAYVAIHSGTQQIHLRMLDSLETKPISGTEGANAPFFSPDGLWLGFFSDSKLKKIPVSGGTATILGDALLPRGGSWGRQGTIVFAPFGASVLQQVQDKGGSPQLVTRFQKGELYHVWPEFLPDSSGVLFVSGRQIAVQSIKSGERRDLVLDGTTPRYASSGYLTYEQKGNLMAVPFDLQRLEINGTALPVVEGVLQSASGGSQYSLSATGSLIYVPGGVQSTQTKLVWVSRSGEERPLAAAPHAYAYPRLSPDGRRVAVSIADEGTQIWFYDLARDTLTRATFESTNSFPVWTPDGKRIAFYSTKDGTPNLYWELADGSGGLERLTTSEYVHNPNSFSPDGQLLAFFEVNPTTQRDIWILRLSDRKAQPFLRTQSDETAPHFSPDGRWLAYVSNESGRFEVYAQPYPGPGGKWQISTEGGTEPVWNPSGRELFYRSGDKMMAVDIISQPSFSVGKPRMLFEGSYLPSRVTTPNYDVSPDGQRFLMIKPSEQSASLTQIVVVQNWSEELKQKVPTGKK
jgi:serine/threonine-protein kinase